MAYWVTRVKICICTNLECTTLHTSPSAAAQPHSVHMYCYAPADYSKRAHTCTELFLLFFPTVILCT